MEETYYRKAIHEELARRCSKNPKYSLRAFARALKMDAASLSRILNDKKVPSKKISGQIIEALAMNPKEKAKFMASLAAKQKKRKLERINQFLKSTTFSTAIEPPQELAAEVFNVISDWYHYAILEMTFLPDFQGDAKWISKKLGISYAEAQLALNRLLDLKFLQKSDGRITQSSEKITMTDTQTNNAALQRRNKQILAKAADAIDQFPVQKRCASTMTMAIDPNKLPEAKKMILKFNRELCEFLESGNRTEVYELATNLFPLSNEGDNV
jgi:uncharacterized protein (TIGR02147 family)